MREGPGNLGLEERVTAEGAWHVQDLARTNQVSLGRKNAKGFVFPFFLLCLQ